MATTLPYSFFFCKSVFIPFMVPPHAFPQLDPDSVKKPQKKAAERRDKSHGTDRIEAWEEEGVIDFVLACRQAFIGYHNVTTEHLSGSVCDRI